MKKRSQLLKGIGIVLLIGGIFSMPEVFAQGAVLEKCSDSVSGWINKMYVFQYFFSWIWIVFANLVGKLMTNAFVYGEFLGLDIFLWKVWQISRNIANFTLGFYFLYAILKFLFFPSDKDKNPKAIIRDMMITGVLIQASWFIVMVIVDISSILFATVSSLPSQILANTSYLEKGLERSLEGGQTSDNQATSNDPLSYWSKGKIVKLHIGVDDVSKAESAPTVTTAQKALAIEVLDRDPGSEKPKQEEMFDMILPRHDSLSGPLMYLGLAMFKTTDFVAKSSHKGINCVDTALKDVIVYLLHRGMIMLYTLSLFILFIILVGRVGYLWMFIALSPIVFLLKSFKIMDTGNNVFLDIGKMIKLIFQPVKFALFISIMMLVLITLSALFQSGADKDLGGAFSVSTSENLSTLSVPGVLEVGLRNTALTFDHLLLGAISLLFMWGLLKLAAEDKTGIKKLDDFKANVAKLTEKAVMSTPLIPTPIGKIGLGSVYDTATSNFASKFIDKKMLTLDRIRDKKTEEVLRMLGVNDNKGFTTQQTGELSQILAKNSVNVFEEYRDKVNEIRNDRMIGFGDIADGIFTILDKRLINFDKTTYLKSMRADIEKFAAGDAKKYFTNTANYEKFKLLYKELFGSDEGIPPAGNITDKQYKIPPKNAN